MDRGNALRHFLHGDLAVSAANLIHDQASSMDARSQSPSQSRRRPEAEAGASRRPKAAKDDRAGTAPAAGPSPLQKMPHEKAAEEWRKEAHEAMEAAQAAQRGHSGARQAPGSRLQGTDAASRESSLLDSETGSLHRGHRGISSSGASQRCAEIGLRSIESSRSLPQLPQVAGFSPSGGIRKWLAVKIFV